MSNRMKGKPNEKVLLSRYDYMVSWKDVAACIGTDEETLKASLASELPESTQDTYIEAIKKVAAKRAERNRQKRDLIEKYVSECFPHICLYCRHRKLGLINEKKENIPSCKKSGDPESTTKNGRECQIWTPSRQAITIALDLKQKGFAPDKTMEQIKKAGHCTRKCQNCEFATPSETVKNSMVCVSSKSKRKDIDFVCDSWLPAIELL